MDGVVTMDEKLLSERIYVPNVETDRARWMVKSAFQEFINAEIIRGKKEKRFSRHSNLEPKTYMKSSKCTRQ
jgi:hypothetical protein